MGSGRVDERNRRDMNAKKWVSQIVINGSKNFLGYFDCELNAHKAYMDKRKEIKPKYS